MNTSNDILTGLLAVKELEIVMLKERNKHLHTIIIELNEQINALYCVLEQGTELPTTSQLVGFKKGG